ncbi:MAG TPA: DUF5597 domain-containing protein [Bryobacteraceae bacterium]|nr:DUF5597 domain-containing protein [Bryobacteraceae bacterium]
MPLLLTAFLAAAQTAPSPLPRIATSGTAKQLFVDGKPFLALAGELHNSSASSVAYMEPLWSRLAALHLNTVIGTVSWELLEPEEGRFDFTLVDAQIEAARRHGLRLVLIWFGSWKNASSSYTPLWVKRDPARFPVARTRTGEGRPDTRALSPLGEASRAADANAFRALMRHIRETDPQHTVIMMQVENETGLLGDSRDHSAPALAAWKRAVPAELLRYLERNKASLVPELAKVWGGHGFRTSGTWAEVFGDDPAGDEIFMAWHIGRYVGKVAEAGKAELALPMYVNAWLGPQPGQTVPGQYPSGGPVGGMIDIWRAAAPAIDLLAPDIYVADFPGVCAYYTRSGNPLFIPEARVSVPNLFWAVGRHSALGFSPFGIDDVKPDNPLAQAYAVLGGMAPLLLKQQAAGQVTAVVEGADRDTTLSFAGHAMKVRFGGRSARFAPAPEKTKDLPPAPGPDTVALPGGDEKDERGFALLVATAPDELIVAGARVSIRFDSGVPGAAQEFIGTVDEGRFENGEWIAGRRLNGDESFANSVLFLDSDAVTVLRVKLYRQ